MILTTGAAIGSVRRCCYRSGASDHNFGVQTTTITKHKLRIQLWYRSVATTNTCIASTSSSDCSASSSSVKNKPSAFEPKRVVRVYNGLLPTTTTHFEHADLLNNVSTAVQQPQPQRMDYVRGWAWQTVLLQQRLEQKRQAVLTEDDAILLLEHEPVYTLGRGADEQHLTFWSCSGAATAASDEQEQVEDRYKLSRRARGPGTARLTVDRGQWDPIFSPSATTTTPSWDPSDVSSRVEQLLRAIQVSPVICPTNGAPIYRVERGGEVTYHGPGQLVVYPMLDLASSWPYYQPDLHWFLRQTEQVIIDSLTQLGLVGAHRDPVHTGVWMRDRKIAAVGVTASRWITTHGFALNVCPDLAYFDTQAILPCGIEGKGVTSLAEEGVTHVSVQDVAQVVLQNIERTFRVELSAGESIQ